MLAIRISKAFRLRIVESTTVTKCFYSKKRENDKNGEKELETKSPEQNEPNDKAKVSKRLMNLLADMSTDTDLSIVKSTITAKRKESKKKPEKQKSTNIFEVTQNVAKDLGRDPIQTESELLSKLLNTNNWDDLKKLPKERQNLSNLIADMKVEKDLSVTTAPETQYRKLMKDQKLMPTNREHRQRRDNLKDESSQKRIDFFGAKPLGIFTETSKLQDIPDTLKHWEILQQIELKAAISRPPKNYFEKMAQWTQQGKLWKFPIDNEQGMDEEAKIYFTEHIFLDRHLESWCPTKGPVRHFMELVCVGLSKNPYYTVAQKVEHIEWFRKYFDEKKDVLNKVIIDSPEQSTNSKSVVAN